MAEKHLEKVEVGKLCNLNPSMMISITYSQTTVSL